MDRLLVKQLSKTYANGTQALNRVSLDIPKGMYGLLGPNGAGKSTLMRTLATLQSADSGTVSLGPLDVLKDKMDVRRQLGYLPQEFGLYPRISAERLLDHLAILKGITHRNKRKSLVDALLQKTNLYQDRKKRLGGYSGGMKRRFGIAQALLSNPSLLIVDEPTAGLDPAERNRFHNLLSELGQDTIVILSTHIVDDIQELCSKMAIMNKGSVLIEGDPMDLISQLEGQIYEKQIAKSEIEKYNKSYHVISDKLFLGQPKIKIRASEHPGPSFTPVEAQLEDVYFSFIAQHQS